MRTSTGKELAIQAKRLSKEGCRRLELMNEAEASVYRNVNLANYRAWHFGKFLADAKAKLGHGRFTIWRAATFPNVHERKAQRCQELFAKNPKATELSDFSESTVRKFRLGYVPVKERLLLEGDEKVTPAPHHLTFVNEFFRYNRQLRTGKIEHFDLNLFRREIEPMIRRLIDLCGPEWISKLCSGKASSADLGQPTVRSRCWIKWAAPRLFAKYWEERKAPPTPVRPANDCCVARAGPWG